MIANDFTCIDAQCALSALIKFDPTEIVDHDNGNVSIEWREEIAFDVPTTANN